MKSTDAGCSGIPCGLGAPDVRIVVNGENKGRKGVRMRFLHIADVHLGMQPDAGFPWSKERGEAIWESFRRIIRLAGRERWTFC